MENSYVFISYKSEEVIEANWVRKNLEANGISCWMAPTDIPGGNSYATVISNAIQNCIAFVLIFSRKAQSSQWIAKEVDMALKFRKTVLPFMLENCPLIDNFSYYLTDVQMYSAYESKYAALENLLRDIRKLLSDDTSSQGPQIIEFDPVTIDSRLPHFFEKDYLLLGRYRILKRTHTYEEGVQHYIALDQTTFDKVLVKYIDRTVPHSKHAKLMIGFSRPLKDFRHPGIIHLLDEYSNNNYYLQIQKYYNVTSLASLLYRHGVQSIADMLIWALPVCDALIYLHEEKGYFYGALTPRNILIEETGNPVLGDMICATKMGNNDLHHVVPWASPFYPQEVYFRPFTPHPSIEAYALGKIIYCALADIDYIRSGALDFAVFPDLTKVPPEINSILSKCLSSNPKNRYQDIRTLKYDLEKLRYYQADIDSPKKGNFLSKLLDGLKTK